MVNGAYIVIEERKIFLKDEIYETEYYSHSEDKSIKLENVKEFIKSQMEYYKNEDIFMFNLLSGAIDNEERMNLMDYEKVSFFISKNIVEVFKSKELAEIFVQTGKQYNKNYFLEYREFSDKY